MKAALIILLFPLCLTAQDTIPKILVINGTELWMKIGEDSTRISNQAAGTASSATLSTVEAMGSYNGSATVLFINDTIRGGTFFPYSGNDAADNGMVFLDANNNKWKRQTEGQYIKVTWYGAHQTVPAETNQTAFAAARDYVYSHWGQYTTLRIPGGTGAYYLNNTLFYTSPLAIHGEGYFDEPVSRLIFPWNVSGIVFHEFQTDYQSEIINLKIDNQFGITPIDSNVNAIRSRAKIFIHNNHISLCSGIGILLEACAGGDSTTNPIFGNVDFSKVTDNKVQFALIGMRVTGCDANYIKVYDNDFMQNKRWGVDDNGFLGNVFWGNTLAANSNASIAGTATTVHYNGQDYSATILHDDGSGIGKRPDLFPDYWRATIDQASTAWDTTKHYWSGGSRISRHPSGTSQWFCNYEEGDQASPVQNTRSTTLFGVRGAGNPVGGTAIYTNQGWLTFLGRSWMTDKVGIGGFTDVADINHTLEIQSTDLVPVQIRSSQIGVGLNFENAQGNQGGLLYQSGSLYTTTDGVQTALNTTGYYDYNGNGVLNLGTPQRQWNDVYAKRFFRDGVELTGAGGVTRVWLPDNVINNNATANTLADVTGLTFTVVAGSRYAFKVVVVYNSAATTTGSRWTVNGPAVTDISYRSMYNTTAAAATINTLGAYNLPSASNASSLTTNNRAVIEGEILPSANGSVQVRFASEISASAITAIGGRSYLEYQIIN